VGDDLGMDELSRSRCFVLLLTQLADQVGIDRMHSLAYNGFGPYGRREGIICLAIQPLDANTAQGDPKLPRSKEDVPCVLSDVV
jgi:hypothetical protein